MAIAPNKIGGVLSSIQAADGASIDAFSRWRTSAPATLFDNQQQYGSNALVWEGLAVGTGNVSNTLLESTVTMTTGSGNVGAKYTRQTKHYFRYQPGKSQLVFMTFVMVGGAKANVRRRVGYFDDNDGIFFELSGTTLNIVRRTSTSGVVVDNPVAQASWTLDTLLGNNAPPSGAIRGNPSGIALDISKSQILVIDLQWLGVGRVRVGFDIGGVVYYVHEFLNANSLTEVYMKTANLPLRYEIENTGAAGSSTDLKHICTSVVSEGGFEGARGYQFTANRGATALGVTSRRPVLSIRAKTTGPNGVRNTGQILPREIDVLAGNNPALFEVVLNPTTLTAGGGAPAWAAVNATYSLAEYNTDADAIAGGVILSSGYVPAGTGGTRGLAQSDWAYHEFILGYTGLLSVQDTLCLVITSVSGTTNINAAMTWQEQY